MNRGNERGFRFALIATLCAVVGLVMPASTDAAVEGVYPGNGCAPSPSDNVDTDITLHESGAYNIDGTFSRSVHCPIVRQNTTNLNGLNTSFIRVVDNSGSAGFSCSLLSYTHTGTLLDSALGTTGNSWTGTTSISMSGITTSSSGGYYTIVCSVPPNYSRVVSYRIVEP